MEALILYFGKMILCSALMFGYYHLVLKDKTFHHYNRFYLLSVVVVSALLPLLKVSYFTIEVNSDIYRLLAKLNTAKSTQANANNFNYYQLVIYVFGVASVFILGRFFFGLIKINKFRNQFPKEEVEGISFYRTNLEEAPFSFFRNLFWKNSILLNSDLGRQILKHEMVHIEQKHTHDKIFMEIATGIFWFNPIFWFIRKEINLIHEYLADKKSVKNMDTKAFAQMLLASHFSGTVIPATSPFLSSNLKKRLKMLQKPKTKFGYAHRIFALPLVFTLAFVYAVNAKNKEIEKTNKVIEAQLSEVKQDTVRKAVTATLVEVDGKGFDMDQKLKDATDKSLFLINGEQVSKDEYVNFITRNKDKNLVRSYSSFEDNKHLYKEFGVSGPYGEYEKYGVFQVDEMHKMKDNIKKYHKLQDKYAPEWRQYLNDLKKPENQARLEKVMKQKEKEGARYESVSKSDFVLKTKTEKAAAANERTKANVTFEAKTTFKEENSDVVANANTAKQNAEDAKLAAEKAKLAAEKVELLKRQNELLKREAELKAMEAKNYSLNSNVKVYTATSSFKPNSVETVGSVIGAMEKSEQQKNYKILSPEMKVYVDGKEVPYSLIEKISPKLIKSVHVNKKDYNGEKNYTMYIETK